MKNKILLPTTILLLLISLSIAYTQTAIKPQKLNHYGNIAISRVISVYDGDTFRVDVNDFPSIVGKSMPIRINGIDCPEMRDQRTEIKLLAIRAKEFTTNKLSSGKVIKLKNMQRGKYFRIIADIEIDGNDLGRMLIEEGLARKYDGGKKTEWGTVREVGNSSSQRGSSEEVSSPINVSFVASKNSKVFHRPSCSHAIGISKENMIGFRSRDEAVRSGRRGCRACKP